MPARCRPLAASKKGFSTHQLHRSLGITCKSAWFMAHRICEAMNGADGHDPLGGGPDAVVEADETYVGGKAKNRAFRKPAAKKVVVALVERDGRARSFHVANVNAKDLRSLIVTNVHRGAHLITDEAAVYTGVDFIAYFLIDKDTNGKAIFQVKSGGANRATLATLNSDRQREKAEFGFLLTMDPATKAMREEIVAAGKYKHPLLNREDDRIQVVTVAEIPAGRRLDLPMGRQDAVKSAKAAERDDRQDSLL